MQNDKTKWQKKQSLEAWTELCSRLKRAWQPHDLSLTFDHLEILTDIAEMILPVSIEKKD